MDTLIEEILADYKTRSILDEPIPEDAETCLLQPLQPQRPFIDLDDWVPTPVELPADES